MATITVSVQSFLNAANNLSISIDNASTVSDLKTAINSAEGVDTAIMDLYLANAAIANASTLTSLGITNNTYIKSSNNIRALSTRAARQVAKLALASLDRISTDNLRSTYNINLLPNPYNTNSVDPDDGASTLTTGRPWTEFTPAELFASSEKGVWYDPSDITTLFQDVSGTIPVTASGQTVALMRDKSGNGIHATQSTAASRPTYTVYPGTSYAYLNFDGTNDFMVTGSLTFAATSVATMTAVAGIQMDTGASGSRMVMELGTDTSTSNGSFYITAPSTAGDHSFGLRGDAFIAAVVDNVSPSDDILTAQLNIGAATKELELIPRLNGVTKSGAGITWSGAANAGTGTFGTKAMYIGARAGTSLFFKGKFYGMVVRGATSTALQIRQTEHYIDRKLY